ncbi:MAG: ATP-binding protein [Nocardioidaceae bacterium]
MAGMSRFRVVDGPQEVDAAPRELRVQLAADAASVPGARRFVRDGLTSWGRHALVDDAALGVTELTSNAALHSGSRYVQIVVSDLSQAIRISVADSGTIPIAAVVPRTGRPLRDGAETVLPLADQPTTGRGLVIVSTLARAWGVDETTDGKAIWAELATPGEENPVRPPLTSSDASLAMPSSGLPPDWHLVRLEECPVLAGLFLDQHLDELIRELQLIDADLDAVPSRELAAVIARLLDRSAHARHTARRVAQDAAMAGLTSISIDMPVPAQTAIDIQELEAAVAAADRLCESRQLMTLASPPETRLLRAWMTHEFVQQIEHSASPVRYAEWRVANR